MYLTLYISPPSHSSHSLLFHQDHFTYKTAFSQFKSLNSIPLAFFITHPRSRLNPTASFFISLLILLSGDIHYNTGPVSPNPSLNMCTLNIRSLTNRLHYTALADLADTHNIHVFALTETWLNPNNTSSEIFDAIPHGFTFISNSRPVPSSCTSKLLFHLHRPLLMNFSSRVTLIFMLMILLIRKLHNSCLFLIMPILLSMSHFLLIVSLIFLILS